MRLFKDPTERYSIVFLVSTFIVGLILHLIPDLRPLILKLTELYLFLINSLVFAFGLLNNHRNLSGFTFWSIFTILCIYLIEVTAINTGLIFGSFAYGDTFATTLSNVPLIIPFNWGMMILASYGFVSKLFENRYLRALISSIIFTLLVIIMEPVATQLGYWHWEGGKIPVQNYFAWFFVSFIFSSALALMKIHARSSLFKIYIITQFLFYITLLIFL